MGRKKKRRFVQEVPETAFFKPQGIPMRELRRQAISVEGFEALRLVDGEGLMQQEAADRMGVSRPTLSRILGEARKGIATALTNGWAIEIEGGNYHLSCGKHDREQCMRNEDTDMPDMDGTGPAKGRGQGRGQGRGMERGQGRGPCGQGGNRQRSRARLDQAKPATTGTIRKIAITSEGPTLDDRVDPRFGRAAGFVLVDLETMKTEYIDNGATQTLSQGAGIQAAENVANAKADAVLSGYVGPKAFAALSAAGIRIGQDVDGMTVGEAVDRFKAGDVKMADAPNATGGAHK